MFEFILLDALDKLKQERTDSAVYHILTGKRSAQTIQDVHIFRLKNYFGIYKSLLKEDFNKMIDKLKADYLIEQNGAAISVTPEGLAMLDKRNFQQETKEFHGLDYDRLAEIFFDRLTLFIQSASNALSEEKSFFPVTENLDVQEWIKQFYKIKKMELDKWFDRLYQELYEFLLTLDEVQASIFVDRLSGFNHYGLSRQQIKEKYNLTIHETNLFITLIIHKLISWILNNLNQELFLREFLPSLENTQFNTESAAKTSFYLKKGFTIEEIASIRKLRESTVYDHIVEIAYQSSQFDYRPYLAENEYREILETASRIGSKKLKVINEELGKKYSYFQIRLVLAVNKYR